MNFKPQLKFEWPEPQTEEERDALIETQRALARAKRAAKEAEAALADATIAEIHRMVSETQPRMREFAKDSAAQKARLRQQVPQIVESVRTKLRVNMPGDVLGVLLREAIGQAAVNIANEEGAAKRAREL